MIVVDSTVWIDLFRGHALLHHDRDFDPMAARLGLQIV